jgi:molybdopterin-containing oxidoreductase family membrane subunit
MWLERFVIVITSLHRDYLKSSWGLYWPTIFDWGTYVGSLGLFFGLLVLFIRLLPVISVFEMRELVSKTKGKALDADGHSDPAASPELASEPSRVEDIR